MFADESEEQRGARSDERVRVRAAIEEGREECGGGEGEGEEGVEVRVGGVGWGGELE
jgi:hypothetical protein